MSDRWDPDVVERLARAVLDSTLPNEYPASHGELFRRFDASQAVLAYHSPDRMLAHAREVRALREMESKVRDDVFLSRFFRDELAALDAAREGNG